MQEFLTVVISVWIYAAIAWVAIAFVVSIVEKPAAPASFDAIEN